MSPSAPILLAAREEKAKDLGACELFTSTPPSCSLRKHNYKCLGPRCVFAVRAGEAQITLE